MFRQGIVTFFDEGLAQGFIELKTDHQRIFFILEDFSNTSVLPQIGERVKCVVVEQDGTQFAKFIVRLDHKNSTDEKSSQYPSSLGGDSFGESARNARKILKKRRIQEESTQQVFTISENQSPTTTEIQVEKKPENIHELSVSSITELTKVAGMAVSDLSKQGLTKIDVDEKRAKSTINHQNLARMSVQDSEHLQVAQSSEVDRSTKADQSSGQDPTIMQDQAPSSQSEAILENEAKSASKATAKPKKKTGKNKKITQTTEPKIVVSKRTQEGQANSSNIVSSSTVPPAVVRAKIENALVNLLVPNQQKQAESSASQQVEKQSQQLENNQDVQVKDVSSSETDAKGQLFTQAAKVKVKQKTDTQDDTASSANSDHSYRVVQSVSNHQTVNMQIFEHNKVYQAENHVDTNTDVQGLTAEGAEPQQLMAQDIAQKNIEAGDVVISNIETPNVEVSDLEVSNLEIPNLESQEAHVDTQPFVPVEMSNDEVLAIEVPSVEIASTVSLTSENVTQVQHGIEQEQHNHDAIDTTIKANVDTAVQQSESVEPLSQHEAKVETEFTPEVLKEGELKEPLPHEELFKDDVHKEEIDKENVPKDIQLPETQKQNAEIIVKHDAFSSQLFAEQSELDAINLENMEAQKKYASYLASSKSNVGATQDETQLEHIPRVEDQEVVAPIEKSAVQELQFNRSQFNGNKFGEMSQLKKDVPVSEAESDWSVKSSVQSTPILTEVPILGFREEINAENNARAGQAKVNSYAQNQLDRQLIEQRMHPSALQKLIQNLKIKFLYSKRKKQPKPIVAKSSGGSFNPVIIVMFALLILSVSVVMYAVDYYKNYKIESALKLEQYQKKQKQLNREQKREAQRR